MIWLSKVANTMVKNNFSSLVFKTGEREECLKDYKGFNWIFRLNSGLDHLSIFFNLEVDLIKFVASEVVT